MRLLIIEEQLRDERSHHLQYLRTIRNAALESGVDVVVAANADFTEPKNFAFSAEPVLSDLSRLANSAAGSRWQRHGMLARNILANAGAVRRLVLRLGPFDSVFCMTAWWPQLAMLLLAKWGMIGKLPPIGLLFVNYPKMGKRVNAQFQLVRMLVRLLGKNVTLFAETKYARQAWEEFLGRPVHYVVHPVEAARSPEENAEKRKAEMLKRLDADPSTLDTSSPARRVVFGFYGFARHEQGVDVLMRALEILKDQGELNAEFRIVWPNAFQMPDRSWINRDMFGHLRPNVRFYGNPLSPADYFRELSETDWLILPYRVGSYEGRCSRISIEACVMGIPVIYSKGTDLEEVVRSHGEGIGVPEEDADALANAIRLALQENRAFKKKAVVKQVHAQAIFSGRYFLEAILGKN
jgi:glycosyltransferase involved in cell wall biosynthesis